MINVALLRADYRRAVELAATTALLLIKAREDREDAVHRMHTAGLSYARIGQDLGLSKSRVQQLVEAAVKRATADTAIADGSL